MRRHKPEHRDPHIDVVPLIDCILVLLIFFMVTTTFAKDAELQIERPGASSGTPASTKALRVYIDRSLNLYLDEAPVRPWMLQSRVRDALGAAADKAVLVVADRRVPADKLIEVIDHCRLAGGKSIGVVTDAERRRLRQHLVALAIAALGTVGAIGLSLGMNAQVQKKETQIATVVDAVAMTPASKPNALARKQRSSPVRKAARLAPSPAPALAAGLAGLDFGLDGASDAIAGTAMEALIAEVGASVMREDEVEEPPQPTAQEPPAFPARARQSGQTGAVTISFVVDVDGSVQDAHVVEATPAGVFEEAALEAVSHWTFEPARHQGVPVAVRVRQTLRFELE